MRRAGCRPGQSPGTARPRVFGAAGIPTRSVGEAKGQGKQNRLRCNGAVPRSGCRPSARQSEIDELDGVRAVATAQGLTRIPDPGDQLAVTRHVRLALRNRTIECPRLRHLQRLLRLPGAASDERGTGGFQIILRGRSFADCRLRQGGRDIGSRIGGRNIARVVR